MSSMTEVQTKIAAGLERAFAAHGFASPSVDDLRDAAGVSLRTLYKYAPSRSAMTLMALEHRHRRYIEHVLGDTDNTRRQSFEVILDRVADWMRTEASHGCLFHAAVAAAPDNPDLRALLTRHKAEVSQLVAAKAGLERDEDDVLLIIEGLTQAWSLSPERALASAKRLAGRITQTASRLSV